MHIAPRKVRLVAGLLRGKNVSRAELELQHLPQRAATSLLKLLRSALAGAKHNFQIEDTSNFYIKSLTINSGPMLKRFRPRAFGRAAMIRKKTSHVELILESKSGIEIKSGKKPGKEIVIKEADLEDKSGNLPKDKSKDTFMENRAKQSAKGKGFVKKVFSRKAI